MHIWKSIIEYRTVDDKREFVNFEFNIGDELYERTQWLYNHCIKIEQDDISTKLREIAKEAFIKQNNIDESKIIDLNVFLDDPLEFELFTHSLIGYKIEVKQNETDNVVRQFNYGGDDLISNTVTFVVDGDNRILNVKNIEANITLFKDENKVMMPYVPSYFEIFRDFIARDNRLHNKVRTYFKITGDFNPQVITEELGLAPSKTREKDDDRVAEGYKKRLVSLWEYGLIYRKNHVAVDEQMKETVGLLFTKIDKLAELKQKYNVDYTLEVVPEIYSDIDKPVISPPKEIIEFCYLTKTELDIDYYLCLDNCDPMNVFFSGIKY